MDAFLSILIENVKSSAQAMVCIGPSAKCYEMTVQDILQLVDALEDAMEQLEDESGWKELVLDAVEEDCDFEGAKEKLEVLQDRAAALYTLAGDLGVDDDPIKVKMAVNNLLLSKPGSDADLKAMEGRFRDAAARCSKLENIVRLQNENLELYRRASKWSSK
jgi:hypothetical protein